MSALVQLGNPAPLQRVGPEVRALRGSEKAYLAMIGVGAAFEFKAQMTVPK